MRELINSGAASLFRAEGLRVATVVDGNKVKLTTIVVGQDDGKTVEVVSGLGANSQVVQDPPDSLIDGETVDVTHPTPERPAESGPQANSPTSGGQKGASQPSSKGRQK